MSPITHRIPDMLRPPQRVACVQLYHTPSYNGRDATDNRPRVEEVLAARQGYAAARRPARRRAAEATAGLGTQRRRDRQGVQVQELLRDDGLRERRRLGL